ncbi:Lysophospholipase L1 [Pseudarthrobacter enclensis]|uniref:GDSL family lipase n=1 Tax=Pseudarthrobacter enclensis TaxID=993070 RepID=A0A0V8IVC1_9MICC|nr:SGNH/GDSL hydrolase family protein [Pseudarthrobacter enclensis]KSU78722.1 GDSL family lipase [Pseudarthrobacter enclensis]SCB76068.1 Lysophospholipase L1 [Pseudarthrobacter enclensis]
MRGNGRRPGAPAGEWIKYAALVVLAVAAFGVAALALLNPNGLGAPESGDTEPAAVSTQVAATPTATATASASATASPAASTPAAQPRIELPANPVLLIMGDSYTFGDGADQPEEGWAYQVADSLGYPTNIDGRGGTGFAWGGGARDDQGGEYEVRLRQTAAANPAFMPNLLILQGGQNDAQADSGEVTAATRQTIEAARRFWPGVQVVVMGPSAPQPLAGDLREVNNAVRAGADAAHAPFIDAIAAGWFTDANSPGFDADGAHPNSAGHAYIAGKFLESWAELTR